MGVDRPMRFGYGYYGTGRDDLDRAVRAAEGFGYDTFVMPDHLGDQLSPIPTLAAVGLLSEHLRVAPWVLCNDFHLPEVVGRELATIDELSRGRLDIGIGSGWHRGEYDRAGIPFDDGPTRFRRLKDSVAVIQALTCGGPVTVTNGSHRLDGHIGFPPSPQRPHPPLMLGGGGRLMIEWAARAADIVSIIPKAAPGGGLLASEITIEAVERKVGWARAAAPERFPALDVNLVFVELVLTSDRRSAANSLAAAINAGRVPFFVLDAEVTEDDLLGSPYFAIGTVDDIVEHVRTVFERTGANYYGTFPHIADGFGPVVERLR